jgi:hypothetical protein
MSVPYLFCKWSLCLPNKLPASQVWWCILIIPATQEAEAGGLWVQGQPRQHSETLSQKKKISLTK